jgi:HEPN domain-containing protein
MSAVKEAVTWSAYAESNLGAAKVLLDAGYLNPCLQEAQQAAEKALKSVMFLHDLPLKKTHSIRELKAILVDAGVTIDIENDLCHTLDSIYIPSKYPLASCLPDCDPDDSICITCIEAAEYLVRISRTYLENI